MQLTYGWNLRDTSGKPAQVTNPIGTIVLSHNGFLDDGSCLFSFPTSYFRLLTTLSPANPLATGFPLTQGSQLVTVPAVTPGSEYAIVCESLPTLCRCR